MGMSGTVHSLCCTSQRCCEAKRSQLTRAIWCCSSNKRVGGSGGGGRAANGRAAIDASTYSSALSSGTASQADSATGVGGGGGGQEEASQPEVDAWQAGFEAGQEAAAWARLPSGSYDADGAEPMIKTPIKVLTCLSKMEKAGAFVRWLRIRVTECTHLPHHAAAVNKTNIAVSVDNLCPDKTMFGCTQSQTSTETPRSPAGKAGLPAESVLEGESRYSTFWNTAGAAVWVAHHLQFDKPCALVSLHKHTAGLLQDCTNA